MKAVRGCIALSCLWLIVFCFVPYLAAEEKAGPKGKTEHSAGPEKAERIIKQEIKKISGELSSINNDFISILYKRDLEKGVDYEILLPLDKNVQLKYINKLKDLKEGDRISITYDEDTVELENRQESRRKAREITFIGPGKQRPEPVRHELPPPEE